MTDRILNDLQRAKDMIAEPGEFTKRGNIEMSREEAIDYIQKAMNHLYDTIHPMPKVAILQELSTAKRLLESEPPAGEFTRKIKEIDRLEAELEKEKAGRKAELEVFKLAVSEARREIDRLEAEKEDLVAELLHIDNYCRANDIDIEQALKNETKT